MNANSGKRRQKGQAMVEYLIGLMLVYWILFDAEFWNGKTASEVVTEALQKNYQGFEYAQSQPSLE